MIKAELLVNKFGYSEVGNKRLYKGEIVNIKGHDENSDRMIAENKTGVYEFSVTEDQVKVIENN